MIKKRYIFSISFLTLFICYSCSFAQKNTKPYNILLIVADDMNEYGFFKTNPIVQTPNIDKFRKKAISFRHAYCPAPACSPSRSAFLSGTSPHRNGKYYNGSAVWETPLLKDQETMMEWLIRIGYNCYGKGKLFHSQISKERVAQNFNGTTGKAGFAPFPDAENQHGGRFNGMQAFPDEDFPDIHNADAIIKLLQSDQEKPFFMMYGLWRPHSPYTCPQRFFDMYDMDDIKIPEGYSENDIEDLPPLAQAYLNSNKQSSSFKKKTETDKLWKEFLRGYYACYSFADWNIGRVLDALENSDYAENTIVIVTSDNGFHMGEKNRFDKNGLWELSTITPMAVFVPGSKHKGKLCQAPINLQDLYPTFVDYCSNGMAPMKPIDGHSLKPLLENPKAKWEYPSITYFGKNWIGLRSEKYRYIQYPNGTEELYDHTKDKWEWNNLANNPEYDNIKNQFQQYIPESMAEAIPGKWTTEIKKIENSIEK